jgi:hypothetical protein
VRRKLSPAEIVEKLLMIEALTSEGSPIAEAIQTAGVLEAEYDQWRSEYSGLLRTLRPLLCASPRRPKKSRRAGPSVKGKRLGKSPQV